MGTDTVAPKPTRADKRAARLANPDRLPFGRMLAWSGAGISAGANTILLGYLSLYATDSLGLAPAVIGLIILISNIVNGVCGIVAAWIVDRSPETRWGKARPYEIAVIGIWVATYFLYATPVSLSATARAVWLGVWFVAINAIFDTLLRANDNLYMARAFPTRNVYAKVAAQSGILTALGVAVIFITMPMILNTAGKDPAMWASAIGVYSLILGIIGLSRGLWVKEQFRTETTDEPVHFRDMFTMMATNRWIWLLGMLFLLNSFVGSMGVGSYYFRYIVGDLGLQGLLGFANLVIMPSILLLPWLMRKFSVSGVIRGFAVLGIIGGAIYAVAGSSVPLLILGGFFAGLAVMPFAFLSVVLTLDLATYNESKGMRRLESTLGALNGIFGKVGAGLGGAALGFALQIAQYDGTLAQQAPSANTAIWALFWGVPVAASVIFIVVMTIWRRFDRDIMPGITAEAEARRIARHNTETGDHLQTPPIASSALDLDRDGRIDAEEAVLPAVVPGQSGGVVAETPPTVLGLAAEDLKSDPDRRGSYGDQAPGALPADDSTLPRTPETDETR